MSEYQYYEFQAIDRALTSKEKEEICKLSSRVKPTANVASFVYHYGNFPGRAEDVLAKYFDIMYYIANWGSHQLAFRFPKNLISAKAIAPYCLDNCIELSFVGDWAILNWQFGQEDGFNGWIEGEGTLDQLIELHQEILDQDYRGLYLAWLKGITLEEEYIDFDPNQLEAPIPADLQKLSQSQKAFCEIFEVNPHLLTVAQSVSPVATPTKSLSLESAIAQLSRAECDDFLVRLAKGERNLATQLKRTLAKAEHLTSNPTVGKPQRKIAQLLAAASEQEAIWERQELEKAEKVRIKALQAIAPKADAMWAEIDTLLVAPKTQNYDQALKLLIQLRDLANYQNQTVIFQERVQRIAKKYPNRTGLLDRLRKAELC
jgi:hypothetical protein